VVENFNNFIEIDPNSLLTVTPTKVTWTNLQRQHEALLYLHDLKIHKEFNIDFTVNLTAIDSLPSSNEFIYALVICDTVPVLGNPWWWDGVSAYTKYFYVGVDSYGLVTNRYDWWIQDQTGEQDGSTLTDYALDTPYYLRLIRDGSAVTCDIYSDAARTTKIDTMSITLGTACNIDYSVLLCPASSDTTKTIQSDGYIENLIVTIPFIDPKITITSLLNTNINAGTYDITKDDGSTNTTFLAEFDMAEETIKELLGSYDVVVSISQDEALKDQIGLQTWEERIPINLDVYVLDKYTAGTRVVTGTKVRWKAKDELIKLIKAKTIIAGGNIKILEILEDEDSDITTERPYLYHSTIKTEAVFVRHG